MANAALALLVGLALAWSSPALAHGGGLNQCGCHFNRKTGECHCHRNTGCGCACQPSTCDSRAGKDAAQPAPKAPSPPSDPAPAKKPQDGK